MKLFIANTTKHIQQFGYRIPEFGTRLFEQKINPGEQAMIFKDDEREVLEGILEQHTKTPKPWCISVEEAGKHKGFVGLIYSFEKPVKEDKIESQFEKNDEALVSQGEEQRKEAAAAQSLTTEAAANERGAGLKEFEMSVTEETKKGEESGKSKLNETIAVVKEGRQGKNRGRK